MGTPKGQGRGGSGGLALSGLCRGGGGVECIPSTPVLEARANEQSKAVFPTTAATAPPHPRTNTSALPKGVSHSSPSEDQALFQPIPATNEGFGSRMSCQIELRADLWWDWHRIQVILKVTISSGREEGSGFLSQILADVGMKGMIR